MQKPAGSPAVPSVFPDGPGAKCAAGGAELPPLPALQLYVQERQPFTKTFRQGVIRRCRGCLGGVQQEIQATTTRPYNYPEEPGLREVPKGWDVVLDEHPGQHLLSLENALSEKNYPYTEKREILLYDDFRESLSPAHIQYLAAQ